MLFRSVGGNEGEDDGRNMARGAASRKGAGVSGREGTGGGVGVAWDRGHGGQRKVEIGGGYGLGPTRFRV